MQDEPSDAELIQQCLDGSVTAFDLLVIRYQGRLIHSIELVTGNKEDAQDIAQQAFVSAWRQLGTFRRDSAFYSWLYRIAINASLSKTRRERFKPSSLDNQVDATGQTPPDHRSGGDPEEQLNSREEVKIVQEALKHLGDEFRQAIVLKEIDGLSYEEIAAIVGIPIGTVRSRIFRARRELTESLKRLVRDHESNR